jgi:cytochrome c oxidase cbb3-type subunit IV
MNPSMDINFLRSLVTAISFALFVGIVLWAYRPARQTEFDEAAHLPFAGAEKQESQP